VRRSDRLQSNPSRVQDYSFRVFLLVSAAGAQQGDPLGPLLFALVYAFVVRECPLVLALRLRVGFLDDVLLGGSPALLAVALAELLQALAAVGLETNASKSEVVQLAWAFAPSSASACRAHSRISVSWAPRAAQTPRLAKSTSRQPFNQHPGASVAWLSWVTCSDSPRSPRSR
jgi:hypothetical protein